MRYWVGLCIIANFFWHFNDLVFMPYYKISFNGPGYNQTNKHLLKNKKLEGSSKILWQYVVLRINTCLLKNSQCCKNVELNKQLNKTLLQAFVITWLRFVFK